MSVDIQVRYVAPPDFGLSPPYYRPGSTLTLSCIATGASDSVAFQWTSTYPQSFTYGARNAVRSKTLLTAYDSWTHTCTITDTDRATASARVKVFLYGKQVHLVLVKVPFFLFQVLDSMFLRAMTLTNRALLTTQLFPGEEIIKYTYAVTLTLLLILGLFSYLMDWNTPRIVVARTQLIDRVHRE